MWLSLLLLLLVFILVLAAGVTREACAPPGGRHGSNERKSEAPRKQEISAEAAWFSLPSV